MNRRNFFSKLGIGALAVVVAPAVLTQEEPIDTSRYIMGADPVEDGEMSVGYLIPKKHRFMGTNTNGILWDEAGLLRVERNGFYCLNDVFVSYDKQWVVKYSDNDYYYCMQI